MLTGVLGLLFTIALTRCSTESLPTDVQEQTADRLALAPTNVVIGIGTSLLFRATPQTAEGMQVPGYLINWQSSNEAVITVTDEGLVTAVSPGTAILTAVAEKKKGKGGGRDNAPGQLKKNTTVTVDEAQVSSIEVSPALVELSVGATSHLVAIVKDGSGEILEGRYVSWSTLDPTVSQVDAEGNVTGIAEGNTTVSAESEGKIGSSNVTVTANSALPVASVDIQPSSATVQVGGSVVLVATAKDTDGNLLQDRQVDWFSSDPSVAIVDETGHATGIAEGTATIKAESEGVAGAASLTVVPASDQAIIFQDGFESGDLSLWDGFDPTKYSVTSQAARVKTGSYSLQAKMFPSDDWGELNKWFMPGYDEVYLSFDVMFEEGFQNLRGDGAGMHFIAQLGNRIDDKWSASGKAGIRPNGHDFFLSVLDPEWVWNDPTLRPLSFYSYFPDMSCGDQCWGNVFIQDPPKADLMPGRWYEIVFYMRANTPGTRDGAQTLWIDGVKKIDIQNMRWRDTYDVRLNQISVWTYMPGAPKTQYLWIDNVVVSRPSSP
jgi:uncharacterized protein YjdB